MPTGLNAFEKHSSAIQARRSAGGEYQQVSYFGLKDGQTARIRFLEQGNEIAWALSHRIKPPGMNYPQDILCMDQNDEGTPCPGCMSDNKEIRSRSTKGYLNVIWRGNEDEGYLRSPVYKLNDKGFAEKNPQGQKVVTGFEDSVWLWKCSKTVLEQIFVKDTTYKGLMSRDFVVSRKGAGLENTVYAIEPAVIDGGAEGMTVADASLSQKKFDVVSLTTPGTFEEMQALLSGQQSGGNGNQNSPREVPAEQSVFSGGPAMRSSAFSR